MLPSSRPVTIENRLHLVVRRRSPSPDIFGTARQRLADLLPENVYLIIEHKLAAPSLLHSLAHRRDFTCALYELFLVLLRPRAHVFQYCVYPFLVISE